VWMGVTSIPRSQTHLSHFSDLQLDDLAELLACERREAYVVGEVVTNSGLKCVRRCQSRLRWG
jgi:hypothetical protein